MVAAATALIQVRTGDRSSCIQYDRLLRKLQYACCGMYLVKPKENCTSCPRSIHHDMTFKHATLMNPSYRTLHSRLSWKNKSCACACVIITCEELILSLLSAPATTFVTSKNTLDCSNVFLCRRCTSFIETLSWLIWIYPWPTSCWFLRPQTAGTSFDCWILVFLSPFTNQVQLISVLFVRVWHHLHRQSW